MDSPANFEQAMSVLTAAIGHAKNNPPTNSIQSMRLGEQVARLDGIWARNENAIRNAK